MRQFKITSSGAMVHTQSPLLEGWEKCEDIKTLLGFVETKAEMPEANINWLGSKLSASLMQQMLGTIRQFPNMEVAFSLYYSLADQQWAVKCPQQNGSGGSVHFEDDGSDMPAGYSIIGSVHTHPNMGAFWSSTDLNDQKKKHGVHLVLGLRAGKPSEYKLSIFTPNGQYDKDWSDIIEAVDFNENWAPVDAWVEEIKAQRLPRPVYAPATTDTKPTTSAGYSYGEYRHDNWTNRWNSGFYGGHSKHPYYNTNYDYDDIPLYGGYQPVGARISTTKPENNEKIATLSTLLNDLRRDGELGAIAKAFADTFRSAPNTWYINDAEDIADDNDKDAALFLCDELVDRLHDILQAINLLSDFDDTLMQAVIGVLEQTGYLVDEDGLVRDTKPVVSEVATC